MGLPWPKVPWDPNKFSWEGGFQFTAGPDNYLSSKKDGVDKKIKADPVTRFHI